jgi:tetratricopeptide (TPR) repeat protein
MNPDGLIPLTGVSPRVALAAARAVLAGRPGPREASIAHQAAAIVLRDFGDVDAAIREFRLAARLARAAADSDREADVLTSLGTALVMAGRTQAGLAALDDALAMVTSGTELGRILVRRGGSLHIAGRYAEAQADLRRAITLTRQAGDTLWQARGLTAAALAHLAVGAVDRAEAGLAAAELLFAGTGQRLEIAYARHNRALVAFASGDLPDALRHLDDAADRYADLGVSVPDAALDRCAVLLTAGLPIDALAGVEAALTGPVTATKQAELLLAAARIALAAGRYHQAAERSAMARSMFTAQHREWWRAHATFVLLQARFLAGRPPARLLPEARRTAARLEALRSDEAPNAWLLAGRFALALGRSAEADRLLAGAARAARRRVPAFARAAGWLAEALRAEAARDQRRLRVACERGLALLEAHLDTLGAAELRAHATAHGTELAGLALRAALRSGRPRRMLEWSERWRAVAVAPPWPSAALQAPPVGAAADPAVRAELAALRDVTVRLEKVRSAGYSVTVLQRERLRLEDAIRARTLRAAPDRAVPAAAFAAGAALAGAALADAALADTRLADTLLATLGPARLVELITVDGELHVLVCGDGRIRRRAAGAVADAAREVDFARFGLNRIARGHLHPNTEPPEQALAALAAGGRRLDALLLGAARDQLGTGR